MLIEGKDYAEIAGDTGKLIYIGYQMFRRIHENSIEYCLCDYFFYRFIDEKVARDKRFQEARVKASAT